MKIFLYLVSFALGWSLGAMVVHKSRKWKLISLLLALVWIPLVIQYIIGFLN